MQGVLLPYRRICGPHFGIDPRVPEKRTRIGGSSARFAHSQEHYDIQMGIATGISAQGVGPSAGGRGGVCRLHDQACRCRAAGRAPARCPARHDPVRPIQTGIGPVEVSKPRARDRGATADERIRYSSAILPKSARRTKSLDVLLPALYLRGVSTGDFQNVLTALLGKDAPNLSPSVIGRLKSEWKDEYRRWQTRALSARRYVYVWADGV
jgi:hypothetical protein